MSDSSVKVRELLPRRRHKLPAIGGFVVAVFVATLLLGSFIAITTDEVQLTTDIP